jgi:siroheme synthase (precorrin-2 oxidase/ferrochelatase)
MQLCLYTLREDHQLQELVPAKALVSASVSDAKLDEALAKECQARLS